MPDRHHLRLTLGALHVYAMLNARAQESLETAVVLLTADLPGGARFEVEEFGLWVAPESHSGLTWPAPKPFPTMLRRGIE